MDIIDYINTNIKTASSIDEAIEMLNTMCSGLYYSDSPTRDYNILKERFGVDPVLVDKTLVFNVTTEMVDLVNNDMLIEELETIGLDKNKFEI